MVEKGIKENQSWSAKWQTLSQPTVNWLKYVLIEQKWEENRYRLNARKEVNHNLTEVGEQVVLIGTKEDINQKVWQEVIYVSPEEKDQIKAQEIAGKLKSVYQRLKTDLPFCHEFYFQWDKYDKEGFEVLCEYIRAAHSATSMGILKIELEKVWLTCRHRSNFENSIEKNLEFLNWAYRFKLVSIEDNTLRQKLSWNTEICAERIKNIFDRMNKDNKEVKPINLMEDPETMRMLEDLTHAYPGSIIELFEKYLNPEVKKHWLTLLPPNNNIYDRNRYDLHWFRVIKS